MDYFSYRRRLSSVVSVGDTPLGGNYPIRIQSMATVSTMDTEAAVNQAIRMIKAGAEYVRFTAQNEREVKNLRNIRLALTSQGYDTPLVADVHFNPDIADRAASIVEKVRINPGNYVGKTASLVEKGFFNTGGSVGKTALITEKDYTDETYVNEQQKIRARFIPFLKICRDNNTAIRIGVNHGSLSGRIMNRYGDTPEGMVESCMEFLRLCAEEKFDRVVISIKASNTVVMIRTVRLLVRTMDAEGMHYPLHLGVTEAGEGEDGRIKSSVGIGALLVDGYGDTIRVSLSEDPEAEIPVARKLINYISTLSIFSNPAFPTQTFAANTIASPLYDPVHPTKRKSRPVDGIGGDNPPVVISDLSGKELTLDGAEADWIYTTHKHSNIQIYKSIIIDAANWQSQPGTFPLFSVFEKFEISRCNAKVKFISLTYRDLNNETIHLLKTDQNTVAIVNSHYIGEARAFMHRLLDAGCDVPVIFRREYDDDDMETVQIKAAVDFGTLLTDGFGDGIMMCHKNKSLFSAKMLEDCMFGILQAARVRFSKTEYISCPGCGRTQFDLQKTIARVKAATGHLKGLKIAIMGCIVNGPGEMADADYGYVGAGRGQISLYKGKTCLSRNIPEAEAVERLLELIK